MGHFRVRTFFFSLICSELREKGWIVNLRQVIPTSPLSLWYGTFPREEFFGFILIKTWMHTEFSMANAGSRKSECLGLTSYAWKILVPGIDGYILTS
jgi:hypothetical protein